MIRVAAQNCQGNRAVQSGPQPGDNSVHRRTRKGNRDPAPTQDQRTRLATRLGRLDDDGEAVRRFEARWGCTRPARPIDPCALTAAERQAVEETRGRAVRIA